MPPDSGTCECDGVPLMQGQPVCGTGLANAHRTGPRLREQVLHPLFHRLTLGGERGANGLRGRGVINAHYQD